MEKVIDNGTILRDVADRESGLPDIIEETYQKIRLEDSGAILFGEGDEKIFVPYFQIYEIKYIEEKPDFSYE